MASIKELLSAMIAKINGKNEGVDWNENDETSPAFVKNRPFYYDKSLVSVPFPRDPRIALYKVSDDVPTGHPAIDDSACIIENGNKFNVSIIISTDDYYVAGDLLIVVALKDNAVISEVDNLTFPEKGTYFIDSGIYPTITGFALGADADPEITWAGNTEKIKKLDEKFLPAMIITQDSSGVVSLTDSCGSKILSNDFERSVNMGYLPCYRYTAENWISSAVCVDMKNSRIIIYDIKHSGTKTFNFYTDVSGYITLNSKLS